MHLHKLTLAAWLEWEVYFKLLTFLSPLARRTKILLSMTPTSSNLSTKLTFIALFIVNKHIQRSRCCKNEEVQFNACLVPFTKIYRRPRTVLKKNGGKLTLNSVVYLSLLVLCGHVSFVESENTPLLQILDETMAGEMMIELARGHAGIKCLGKSMSAN